MNYTGRYGLEINPFIKNGKDVLVETNEYKENIVFAGTGYFRPACFSRKCREGVRKARYSKL